jgi:hypothetical protein
MSCWCKTLEYICTDCEAREKWDKLNSADKMLLFKYSRAILTGKIDRALTEKILKKGLCVSMIPKDITTELQEVL